MPHPDPATIAAATVHAARPITPLIAEIRTTGDEVLAHLPARHDAMVSVGSDAWFAYIAAQWENRPERLADVTEQVRSIYEKLVEWRMTPKTRDELDHATIAYSHACVSYECVQWLPFDVMPNWEDDLYCVLMDEDFWSEQRDQNRMGYEIAEMIRTREANDPLSDAAKGPRNPL